MSRKDIAALIGCIGGGMMMVSLWVILPWQAALFVTGFLVILIGAALFGDAD